MSSITETKEKSISIDLLIRGLSENRFDLIRESIAKGLDLETIDNEFDSSSLDEKQSEILMAVNIILIVNESRDENYRLSLKKQLGTISKFYLGYVFEKNVSIEKIELPDINSVTPEYFDSIDFLTHCEKITQAFCPDLDMTNMSTDLLCAILTLSNYFIIPDNLLKTQTFLTADTLTGTQLTSAVFEINILFVYILKKIYLLKKIDIELQLPEKITWLFDNPNNYMEIQLLKNKDEIQYEYMLDGSLMGRLEMTTDEYCELIEKTYNLNKMIRIMLEALPINSIMDTIKTIDNTNVYHIEISNIIMWIVSNFIAQLKSSDYVL